MKHETLGALLAVALVTGCKPSFDEALAVKDGQAALGPFKQALQGALKGGLEKGPEAAIEVCGARAPELAREASKDGVRVGRTSEKLRSPANASPAWVTPLLAELAARGAKGGEGKAVALEGGRRGYVEAIAVQPLCLTCHGETIAPAVAERLRARYPEDRATGYREGDLRGVLWVELPAR